MTAVNKTLATIALIFVSFANISPASAHTKVDHTSPAQGSNIDAGVQTVSVSFTEKILNLADSTEIAITDSTGAEVETSCVEVHKTAFSAEAFFATEGAYKAVWRTVAEDGHPITGKFTFTVSGSAANSDFISCQELASQGSAVIDTPKPKVVQKSDSTIPVLFYGALTLLIAITVFAIARRKRTKG